MPKKISCTVGTSLCQFVLKNFALLQIMQNLVCRESNLCRIIMIIMSYYSKKEYYSHENIKTHCAQYYFVWSIKWKQMGGQIAKRKYNKMKVTDQQIDFWPTLTSYPETIILSTTLTLPDFTTTSVSACEKTSNCELNMVHVIQGQ